MKIKVHLPEEMAAYKEDLEFFVSLMVRKLHTNRHKGVSTDLNPSEMVTKAAGEIEEIWEAMSAQGQFETAVECADVANFVFLAAMASLRMTREEFKGGHS